MLHQNVGHFLMQQVAKHFFDIWNTLQPNDKLSELHVGTPAAQLRPDLQELYTYFIRQLESNEEITVLDLEHLQGKQAAFKQKLIDEENSYLEVKKSHEGILFELGIEMESIQAEMKSSIFKEKAYQENTKVILQLCSNELENFKTQFDASSSLKIIEATKLYKELTLANEAQMQEWIEKRQRIQKEIKEWESRYMTETDLNSSNIFLLKSQLLQLNEDYDKLNANLSEITPVYDKILFDKDEQGKIDFQERLLYLSQTIAAKRIQSTWKQYKSRKTANAKPKSSKKAKKGTKKSK
eukprot:NODE_13_length_42895_cov_0.518413.p14 type:complete len:296 gc:universal NODE_13_length_42895_cov_0.518413:12916-13803(+)